MKLLSNTEPSASPTVTDKLNNESQPLQRWVSWFLAALLLGALGQVLYLFLFSWSQPVLDMHSFRQSQTAISVYWMLHGGSWFNYETPVLGYPWTIPFEFPLYQWLVAALSSQSGLSIDQAGRLVSLSFFLATLLPVYAICRLQKLEPVVFPVFAILLLCSPVYLFWSRTVMIESTALFFAVAYLALFMIWQVRGAVFWAILCTLVGILAVLTKVTTFFAFAVAAFCLFAWEALREWRRLFTRPALPRLMTCALLFLLPLLALVLWTHYADTLKNANPLAASWLTSVDLQKWNFGTQEQRLSVNLWRDTIYERSLSETLGFGAIFILFGVLVLFGRCRRLMLCALATALYLLPFLVLTNLHIVHNYYQYANAIFLVFAGALVLALPAVVISGWRFLLLLLGVVVLQLTVFYHTYYPTMLTPRDQRAIPISNSIRTYTDPDSVILIMGYEWSSILAYYSERRAIMVVGRFPDTRLQSIFAEPQRYTGGLALGAVVHCPSTLDKRSVVQDYLAGLEQLQLPVHVVGNCRIFQLSNHEKEHEELNR